MKPNTSARPRRLRRYGRGTVSSGSIFLAAVVAGGLLLSRTAAGSANPPSVIVAEDDLVQVPTPVRPIAKGEKLKDVQFSQSSWPRRKVGEQYIGRLEELRDATALASLPANLPVPRSALSYKGPEGNAVIEGIPEGMRAITVKVDAESAVEGWARSGSYVDVIVLKRSAESAIGIEAKVIAENVRILSAGRSVEPLNGEVQLPGAPQTVTLLVSQQDALKVKTAAGVGRLTFSLRGLGDESPTTALLMDQKSLLGGARKLQIKKDIVKGKAKGPDGRTYLLDGESRWVRELEKQTESES